MRHVRRGWALAAVTLCLPIGLSSNAGAQCRPKQIRKAEKTLRTLSCVQAEFPPGPQGPTGPQGPPGPPGRSDLAYVDGATNLFAGFFDCAVAECAPGDRIVSCGSANFNPNSDNLDPSTVLIGAIGFRDPEDDTPDDVLAADTCIACFANYNDFQTVQILARAVCAVGTKSAGTTNGVTTRAPRSPVGYAEFRALSRHLSTRALTAAD